MRKVASLFTFVVCAAVVTIISLKDAGTVAAMPPPPPLPTRVIGPPGLPPDVGVPSRPKPTSIPGSRHHGPPNNLECLPNHAGRPLAICPDGAVYLFGAPSYAITTFPHGILVESSYADGKPYIFFVRNGAAEMLDAPVPPPAPQCLPDHAGRPLAVCPDGAVFLFGAPSYEMIPLADGGVMVVSSYADGKPYVFILRGDEVEIIHW